MLHKNKAWDRSLRCNVKQGVITVSIGIHIRISHKHKDMRKYGSFVEKTHVDVLFLSVVAISARVSCR